MNEPTEQSDLIAEVQYRKQQLMETQAESKQKLIEDNIPEVIKRDDLTPETLDTLLHFGLNAPALLNQYACAVEDALIEQVHKGSELREVLREVYAELQSLREFKAITLNSLGMGEPDAEPEEDTKKAED